MESCDNAFKQFEQLNQVANLLNLNSFWSVLESTDQIVNDEVFSANKSVTIQYNIHWGETSVQTGQSAPVTYRDLWQLCDSVIKMSGDNHHVFIERLSSISETENEIILELLTGS